MHILRKSYLSTALSYMRKYSPSLIRGWRLDILITVLAQ